MITSLGLAPADFGRDPCSSDSLTESRIFCQVNNARLNLFPTGQILRHLNTTTSISEAVKTFGTEFRKFNIMGRLKKTAKIAHKISTSCDFRPPWLRNDYRSIFTVIINSVYSLGCTLRTGSPYGIGRRGLGNISCMRNNYNTLLLKERMVTKPNTLHNRLFLAIVACLPRSVIVTTPVAVLWRLYIHALIRRWEIPKQISHVGFEPEILAVHY